MSLNVMEKYIKSQKKAITEYASLSLDKYFIKKIFDPLLDTYINVRYYNVFDDMNNDKKVDIINKHLINNAKSLIDEKNEEKINKNLYFFGFVYYLDNVLNNCTDKEILDGIDNFRINKLNLPNLDKQSFSKTIDKNKEEIKSFLESFQDDNFYLNIKKTNINSCYDITIDYKINFPKLYSEYAINKVYNTGIVCENKLFIEYYMVSAIIIKEIRNLNFKNNYLVEFTNSLFEKSDKILRLFNIINDDLLKEKVIIKINYQDFIENKDIICNFINEGYKFALILDSSFILNVENKTLLSLFSFIIINDDVIAKELKDIKNIIKISKEVQ